MSGDGFTSTLTIVGGVLTVIVWLGVVVYLAERARPRIDAGRRATIHGLMAGVPIAVFGAVLFTPWVWMLLPLTYFVVPAVVKRPVHSHYDAETGWAERDVG